MRIHFVWAPVLLRFWKATGPVHALISNFLDRPKMTARKKSNICVALHRHVLAAYHKYASGQAIRDALTLNFLQRRPTSDFLQNHQR